MRRFALALLLIVGCEKSKPPMPPMNVTAFTVSPQTIPADFQFVGVAKSSHPVEIRARVEGYLKTIDYVEGSLVQENQLLFRLDPSQFENSVDEAKGELARQEAELWRNKRDLMRLEPLYEQKAASQRDRDNALAQVLASEAAVMTAKANLEQAVLNLSYTYITSPIKGLTARAAFREGTLITPNVNGLLTEISVIDPIWVDFSISDSELLQARAEGNSKKIILPAQQDYTVRLILADGSDFSHQGVVNFASPTLDPETGAIVVRAQLPNPKGEILPGQFVQVIVSGAYRPQATFVPQQSIFQGNKGMYVFVIDQHNTVSARQVEVGEWYKEYWIINSGLAPGERVVVEGTNKIQNGSVVHVTSTVQSETAPLLVLRE